jgi:hypothetical protein
MCAGALAAAACDKGPVEWRGDPHQVNAPAAASDSRLVLNADGSASLESIAAVATTPADTAACPGSLRVSSLTPTEMYGVWWSRRDKGRASLIASRSDNAGATWNPAVPVDTTDRGTMSCSRPAPSISADPTSGYVHVTYFLHAPGGPGVFFAHSMERGELFHAPVPIMYGERPSASAVASADSFVVVAFEDPNSQRKQISLAMSRTWGHIFSRDRPEASTGAPTAEQPFITMRQPLFAVGWRTQDKSVVARVGALR